MTDRQKARAAARRRHAANRAAILGILLVVSVLFTILFVQGLGLRQRIADNDDVRIELTEKIDAEKARTAEIRAYGDYLQSDEFVREAARDQLGLIEEGDIVFRNAG